MLWLAAHMWILLASSFLIGIMIGWWIWGASAPKKTASAKEDVAMGSLESDFAPAQPAPKDEEEV